MRELAVFPCRGVCVWARSGQVLAGGLAVFACTGCGSEWVRTEPWTPAGQDGRVPPAVAAERAAGRGPG